jgi:hypothetical protein
MALNKYSFRAGVVRDGTQYTAGISYYDVDKVRFKNGRAQQIGGWSKFADEAFFGICRSIYEWTAKDGTRYFSFGTTSKFYVARGGEYLDATPVDVAVSSGITFTAVHPAIAAYPLVLVNHTAHGRVAGDFVVFSGAVTLGDAITADVLNKYNGHRVFGPGPVPANEYYIIPSDVDWNEVEPTAGDVGTGGGSVTADYLLQTGVDSFVSGTGWGSGGWSSGVWGSVTPLSFLNQLRLYSQESFGDDLIINPRGGDVFFWNESDGYDVTNPNRAKSLSDASYASVALSVPVKCLQIIVSEVDRHVIALGCNPIGSTDIDPLLVRWSDEENVFDWQPVITNSAGGTVLSTGSYIVGGIRTRQEILIFTDKSIHSMQFGGEFVFSFSTIAENVTLISPKGGVAVGDAVYFMDRDAFYVYRGAIEPLPCDVSDYVFDNLNKGQNFKTYATHNPDFEEVTWFYAVGSGATEVTNYVIYNYRENHWSIGTMGRGAWHNAPSWTNPVATSTIPEALVAPVNYAYDHEVGYDADGEEMGAYIESGGIELGQGEHYQMISRFIPDLRVAGSDDMMSITLTINGRDFPFDNFVAKDTATIDNTSNQLHVRARTREASIRMDFGGTGYKWTLGDFRFDLRPDGRR